MEHALPCAILAGLWCAPAGPTQDPAGAPSRPVISTDRPSFSESVSIVPPLRLQVETGWTYAQRQDGEGNTSRQTAPEYLFRFGLVANLLELRAYGNGLQWSRTEDPLAGTTTRDRGVTDPSVGAKLRLADQDGLLPNLSVSLVTTLPVGDDSVSSDHFDPTLRFAWQYDLGSGIGLGGNLNLARPTKPAGAHWYQPQASLYLTQAAGPRATVYAEYFVVGEATRDAGNTHSCGFGALYLLSHRVQLDARIGFGLDSDADELFVGLGLSFLF